MNRKQIDLDGAVGKRITAVIEENFGDGVILAIDDDAFVLIESVGDEDGAELRCSTYDTTFRHKDYSAEDLAKVFDQATFTQWKEDAAKQIADAAAKQEKLDRAEFERLKAQFGE